MTLYTGSKWDFLQPLWQGRVCKFSLTLLVEHKPNLFFLYKCMRLTHWVPYLSSPPESSRLWSEAKQSEVMVLWWLLKAVRSLPPARTSQTLTMFPPKMVHQLRWIFLTTINFPGDSVALGTITFLAHLIWIISDVLLLSKVREFDHFQWNRPQMYRELASNVQNSVHLRPIPYTFEAEIFILSCDASGQSMKSASNV